MSNQILNNKHIQYFHLSTINKIAVIIGYILFTSVVVEGLRIRCYVCGPDKLLKCDHFSEYKDEYVKECPPNSKGCSMQKNGSTIIRSCEVNGFNDCKEANGVYYCYCSNNLCNANMPPKKPTYTNDFKKITNEDNDDEDDDGVVREGSGLSITSMMDNMKPTVASKPKEKTSENNASTAIILQMYLSILFSLLLIYF